MCLSSRTKCPQRLGLLLNFWSVLPVRLSTCRPPLDTEVLRGGGGLAPPLAFFSVSFAVLSRLVFHVNLSINLPSSRKELCILEFYCYSGLSNCSCFSRGRLCRTRKEKHWYIDTFLTVPSSPLRLSQSKTIYKRSFSLMQNEKGVSGTQNYAASLAIGMVLF